MPTFIVNENAPTPAQDISCFRDIPEHHDPVEPYYGSQLKPGDTLDGRFLIGEPLSRSGMASIYQAQDLANENRIVAVKIPHLRYESDPGFFERFQREEDIGQKLDHPFILKFIPVKQKSRPYLVTEYLRGCTLSHLLEAMHPLPEKDALKIASLVCEALQHMHSRGVVHRDLKPANIMICSDRTIRLIDFGIASAADARRITITNLSRMLGTPEYMAPEQVSNKPTDERTDIYSLGVILYEMLTGALPFQHENPWIAMTNRVTGDPPAPRQVNPAISPQAEEIVLRAMRRAPDERFQTVSEFKAALDSPETFRVTGLSGRLKKPHWQFGFRETPMLAGSLIGIIFISIQVALFFLIRHHLGGGH